MNICHSPGLRASRARCVGTAAASRPREVRRSTAGSWPCQSCRCRWDDGMMGWEWARSSLKYIDRNRRNGWWLEFKSMFNVSTHQIKYRILSNYQIILNIFKYVDAVVEVGVLGLRSSCRGVNRFGKDLRSWLGRRRGRTGRPAWLSCVDTV